MPNQVMRPMLNVGLAYLVALIILGSGILISVNTSNWLWFSRSGSALVVIGIVFTSSQIIENSRKLRTRKSHPSAVHDWASDDKMQSMAMNRGHENDVWIHGRCGFNMLIAGTIIWGFGDLLGLAF